MSYENLPSILIQPLGRKGFIVIGGWSEKCFTRSDEKWIEGWSKRLFESLEK